MNFYLMLSCIIFTTIMDYSKICRVCMLESKKMHDIFSETKFALGMKLCDSIMSITSVKIEESDGFPKQLCTKCINLLEYAINFKKICEQSDVMFHNAFENSVKTNDAEQTLKIKQENTLDFIHDEYSAEYDDGSFIEYKPDPDQEVVVDTLIVNEHESSKSGSKNYKVYDCNICGRCYSGSKSLQRHMIIHKGGGHNCNQCEKVFSRRDHLRKHLERIHHVKDVESVLNIISAKNIVRYDCVHCGVDAPSKVLMAKHMRACHKDKLPKRKNSVLDIFKETDSESENIDDIDMEDEPVDTRTVNSVMTSSGGAIATLLEERQDDKDQIDLVLKVTYRCHTCGVKYSNQRSYAAHMTKHSGPVPKGQTEFKCNQCDKVFSKRKNLKQHVLIHNKEKANKCSLCHRAFTRPDQLILHMNNHTGKKRHQCSFCDKGFNMLSTLKDHVRIHSGEKPFLCPTCGRGFTQNTNLKQHIMRHNATKPFACPMCQSRFVSKGELDSHLRKHTGDHPFVCDTCGSGFTTSSSLVKHKRIHTGERPYACDLCPLRFTALGTLKNHRRTHTGEKPFACTHCTRAFAQKSDLVSHIRTHTGERPYVCSVCGTPYQQSSALKAHIKVHHPMLALEPKAHHINSSIANNGNINNLIQISAPNITQTNVNQVTTTQLSSPISSVQLTTSQICASPHNTIIIRTNRLIAIDPIVEQAATAEMQTFKISTPENSQSPHFTQGDSV